MSLSLFVNNMSELSKRRELFFFFKCTRPEYIEYVTRLCDSSQVHSINIFCAFVMIFSWATGVQSTEGGA